MKHLIFSQKEQRILRYIVFFVIATRILLAFRSEEAIYTRPFFDDSFYVFNCSEHLAHGYGFSTDGIHPTNGVQPLVVIIYAPLFFIAGADKLLALRLSFVLIALFDSVSVLFLARVVRLLQKKPYDEISHWFSLPVIAAILWAALYPIMVYTANGLETGIYSSLLLATLYYYITLRQLRENGEQIRFSKWTSLGILVGITVLARIDAVFLVVAIALYEIFLFKRKGLLNASIISLTAFIISSPWWWYNYHVFGSLMPQSGSAESLNDAFWVNIQIAALSLGDLQSVFFFLPNYAFPAWFDYLLFLVITVIIIFVARKYHIRQYLKASYNLAPLKPLLLFCAILFFFYILFFSAPYFLPRYLHPFRILYLIIFACSMPEIFRISRTLYARGRKIAMYTLYAIGVCALLFSGAEYVSLFARTDFSDLFRTGKWALLHPNELIGMSQSGVASYIAPNVINLDGKVNFDALQAHKHGGIGSYIEAKKLVYLADWKGIAEQLATAAVNDGGRFEKFDSIGRVIIFKRVKK